MRIVILMCILLCLGCKEKDKVSYLQAQEVALVAPRLEVTNAIIDSVVTLSAALGVDNVTIYYTVDGTVPTSTSKEYTMPLQLESEGIYKFRAYHPDWKPSKIASIALYKKGTHPTLVWETQPSATYPGLGDSTLINNKRGSRNFRSTEWVGFDGTAFAKAELEQKTFVEKITIGYLIDTKSWIFPPEEVTVYVNEKDSVKLKLPRLEEKQTVRMDDVELKIGKEVTSLAIKVENLKALPEWHPGKGNKAWLFMDEWIFN